MSTLASSLLGKPQRAYKLKARLSITFTSKGKREFDKTPTKPSTKPSIYQHRMVILKIPYISERLNHRITNIFRKKKHLSTRYPQILHAQTSPTSHTSTERKCTRDKCSIANTGLRLRRNAVYQLTLIYTSIKHFTLESASLHSIPEKNVLNSQTCYFSILFQRPFLSAFRGLLSRDTPSSELCIPFTVYFYSCLTYVTFFTHFTQHFLCIYT